MSRDHRFLERQIALHLSSTFQVDLTRIDVRVSMKPQDPTAPVARQVIRIEADLDGKTPPPEWGDTLEAILSACARLAELVGAGPIQVTQGVTEDPT